MAERVFACSRPRDTFFRKLFVPAASSSRLLLRGLSQKGTRAVATRRIALTWDSILPHLVPPIGVLRWSSEEPRKACRIPKQSNWPNRRRSQEGHNQFGSQCGPPNSSVAVDVATSGG